MRFSSCALVGLLVLATVVSVRAEPPHLAEVDRVRLAEAFRLAEAVGNQIWPNWDKASFAVLLVTEEYEFLVNHPKPSDDFSRSGYDRLLRSEVWYRKRTYSPDLLATFPAVGGVATVVIGRAENTAAKSSTRWVITLLHEHFHQLQYSQPGYYDGVNALGLARGDQTGMWMLNYAFPYTNSEVNDRFAEVCKALHAALRAKDQMEFERMRATFVNDKKEFQSLLSADDYKYCVFQEWQEGVARYTEYHVAKLAAAEYQPSKAFENLRDYTSFKKEASAVLRRIEDGLSSVHLDEAKRTAFYALGAAEGLVLDRTLPGWREQYWEELFSLDAHFGGSP